MATSLINNETATNTSDEVCSCVKQQRETGVIKKLITPKEVVSYINDKTTVFLTTPDATTHELLLSKYSGPRYFIDTVNGDKISLNNKDIIDIQDVNGDIHITTKDGLWVLHAEEETFNFCCYDDDFLEPHEVKACIKRAAKLQAFINNELFIDSDAPVRFHVRYRVKIGIDESSYLDDTNPIDIYYHKFDYYFGDAEGDVIYIEIGSRDPGDTNEEALHFLAFVSSHRLISAVK